MSLAHSFARTHQGAPEGGNQATCEACSVDGNRSAPCTTTTRQMYMMDAKARYAVKRSEFIRFRNCSGSISRAPMHLITMRPHTASAKIDVGNTCCHEEHRVWMRGVTS